MTGAIVMLAGAVMFWAGVIGEHLLPGRGGRAARYVADVALPVWAVGVIWIVVDAVEMTLR